MEKGTFKKINKICRAVNFGSPELKEDGLKAVWGLSDYFKLT